MTEDLPRERQRAQREQQRDEEGEVGDIPGQVRADRDVRATERPGDGGHGDEDRFAPGPKQQARVVGGETARHRRVPPGVFAEDIDRVQRIAEHAEHHRAIVREASADDERPARDRRDDHVQENDQGNLYPPVVWVALHLLRISYAESVV